MIRSIMMRNMVRCMLLRVLNAWRPLEIWGKEEPLADEGEEASMRLLRQKTPTLARGQAQRGSEGNSRRQSFVP